MNLTTCIVSGPKRSGTTLLNRLFDSQPGVIDLNDEAFFWEHAYKYDVAGRRDLFLDIFRDFTPEELVAGCIDRDIMPWIGGRYKQTASAMEFEMDLDFDTARFTAGLSGLRSCANIAEVWEILVAAYADASGRDYAGCHHCLIKGADYGMSILGGRGSLAGSRNVVILRNPFYALDSLKKSRQMRQEKVLNPFNFGEAVRDYAFLWDNWAGIVQEDTHLVLYEDLVRDPRPVMEGLAAHLGVPFTENLLVPTLQGGEWPGLSSFSATKGIDAAILERPLKVLSAHEVEYVQRGLKDLLGHFGYGPGSQAPSRGGRA